MMTTTIDSGASGAEQPWQVRVKGAKGFLAEGGAIMLALRSDGLFLEGQEADGTVRKLDVLGAKELKYQTKVLGDHLEVGGFDVAIPAGSGAEVKRMLGTARLRVGKRSKAAEATIVTPPFHDVRNELEMEWLASWLDTDEELIAVLDTATEVDVESPLAEASSFKRFYILTSARSALVAIGDLGDVLVTPLSTSALVTKDAIGRTAVSSGDETWHAPMGHGAQFVQLGPLAGVAPAGRAMAAAQLVWATSKRNEAKAKWVAELLARLGDGGHALALLTWHLLFGGRPLANGTLLGLVEASPTSDEVEQWAQSWAFPPLIMDGLMEGFGRVGALKFRAAIHVIARVEGGDPTASQVIAARRDLALGRDLYAAQQPDRAKATLRAALERLPSTDCLHVVAHIGPPAPDGVVNTRIEILEEQWKRRRQQGSSPLGVLESLCAAAPLNRRYLRALVETAPAPLGARAAELRSATGAGGLGAEKAEKIQKVEKTLPAKLASQGQAWQDRIHPLSAEGGPLAPVHSLLLQIPIPDSTETRAYCDEIEKDQHPAAHEALAAARQALGFGATIRLFAAHGAHAVGITGFEGDEPIIVIGASHLAPKVASKGSRTLTPQEFTFAVAVELAQIELGQARVFCRQEWRDDGWADDEALARSRSIFPQLEARPFDSFVDSFFATDGPPVQLVDSLWGSRKGDGALDAELSRAADHIIAKRVMQYSADRIALTTTPRIGVALNAILKTTPGAPLDDLAGELNSLPHTLNTRYEDNSLRHPSLVARINSLAAFWLQTSPTTRGSKN